MTTTIEFFFDVASPYSYLAATQIEAVGGRAGVAVHWRPFLLGGVFRATGNQPPVSVAQRRPYLLRDLARWADRYGVPFVFPDFFPINSLVPMRALAALSDVALPSAARRLFDAHWVAGYDPSDVPKLTALLGEHSVARASDPEVKARLRANTEEAVSRGAFGAPTMFVGDEMFFGNDRLRFVEEAARALA